MLQSKPTNKSITFQLHHRANKHQQAIYQNLKGKKSTYDRSWQTSITIVILYGAINRNWFELQTINTIRTICNVLYRWVQMQDCTYSQMQLHLFACNLQNDLQIRWITIHITIIIITTTILTFGTAGSIVEFEIQLTITISMIIISGESGQGLGVVVFAMIIYTSANSHRWIHHQATEALMSIVIQLFESATGYINCNVLSMYS